MAWVFVDQWGGWGVSGFFACGVFFGGYDDDIGFWGYVREQGEHCGARDIGRAGDFGLCSFGCVDNKVCGFIYGGRTGGEIFREQKEPRLEVGWGPVTQ